MRGGKRPGAGQPPGTRMPRLSAEDTRAALDRLRDPGESWAAMSARLGVNPGVISRARTMGATVKMIARLEEAADIRKVSLGDG